MVVPMSLHIVPTSMIPAPLEAAPLLVLGDVLCRGIFGMVSPQVSIEVFSLGSTTFTVAERALAAFGVIVHMLAVCGWGVS